MKAIEFILPVYCRIGSILYPDQFSGVDPVVKFDEISNKMLGISSYQQISSQYYGGYQQVNLVN